MQQPALPHRMGSVNRLTLLLCLSIGMIITVLAIPPQPAQAAQRAGVDTIILVHGFEINSQVDCLAYWGSTLDYLRKSHSINGQSLRWGRQDFRTVQYYNNPGDSHCGRNDGTNTYTDANENLHNAKYTQHCAGYAQAGADGTNNESLYHVSCLLAWYISLNFGSHPSWNVEIVAHSMGGLVVRNAIYQVQQSKATWTMPSTLGHISDVVTLATPHGGVLFANYLNYMQTREMAPSSSFMNEMYTQAQSPQAGTTDWTILGSKCDEVIGNVDPGTAVYMSGAHQVMFNPTFKSYVQAPCYSHSAITQDENDTVDATIFYCEFCAVPPAGQSINWASWRESDSSPRSLLHMMHALWLSTW